MQRFSVGFQPVCEGLAHLPMVALCAHQLGSVSTIAFAHPGCIASHQQSELSFFPQSVGGLEIHLGDLCSFPLVFKHSDHCTVPFLLLQDRLFGILLSNDHLGVPLRVGLSPHGRASLRRVSPLRASIPHALRYIRKTYLPSSLPSSIQSRATVISEGYRVAAAPASRSYSSSGRYFRSK